jgi:flagellar biosynthetic protein FliO
MRLHYKLGIRLGLLLLTLVFTFGAETAPAVQTFTAPSMGAAVFRMIGALVFVLALFFGAAWLFRNGHRFKGGTHANRKLQVLEAKSLGPRQAIYVVGYEQQRLLIGATAQGLTLLTHLPEGAAQSQEQTVVPVSFGEALMHALGRK